MKVLVESEAGELASTEIQIKVVDQDRKSNSAVENISASMEEADEDGEDNFYEFSVKENLEGALVANLSGLAFTSSSSNSISSSGYSGLHLDDGPDESSFSITDSGLLFTRVALDRETQEEFSLKVVKSRGVLRGGEAMRVRVKVEDENDNSPSFGRRIYQGSVGRKAEKGDPVKLEKLMASDPDLGDEVKLRLMGKASALFEVRGDGEVVVADEDGSLGQMLDKLTYSSSSSVASSANDKLEKLYLRVRATDLVSSQYTVVVIFVFFCV